MMKFLMLAIAVSLLSFFLAQHEVFGQTATPTPSPTPTSTSSGSMTPTPTTVVPSGAPATGFAPY